MNCHKEALLHDRVCRVLRQLQLEKARVRHGQHLVPCIRVAQLERPRPVARLRQPRPPPREPQELAAVLVAQLRHHAPEALHHGMAL